MKKLTIFFIMILLFAALSVGSWTTQKYDLARTNVITGESYIDTSETPTTYDFVCGNGDGNLPIEPMIGNYLTSTSGNELITVCSGDSENANPHAVIYDSSLSEIDAVTVDSIVFGGVTLTSALRFDITNIDADSDYELIIYNPEDCSGNKKLELIVYEIDTATDSLVHEFNYEFMNNTVAWNSTKNVSDCSITENINVMCDGEYCYVLDSTNVFVLDMEYKTKVWYEDISDYNAGFDGADTIEDDYYNYPVFSDIDYVGLSEYCVISQSGDFVCLNEADGSLDYNYTLDYSGTTIRNFYIDYCYASRCASNRDMIIVGSRDGSGGWYCDSFEIDDGDKRHTVETDDVYEMSTINGGACWFEDRDDDGYDELCAAAFDQGSIDGNVVICEEMNILSATTLESRLNWTTTADVTDNNIGYNPAIIADIDEDGYYDIIGQMSLWILNNSETVIEPELIYLNESVRGSGVYINFIASEYTIEDQVSIISAQTVADNDTYYLTLFGDVTQEGTIGNSPIEFRDDDLFTPPYNWVWRDASDDTFRLIGDANYPTYRPWICANSTGLRWECDYTTGCLQDNEWDDFKVRMDCFGDGEQVISTGWHFNSGQVNLVCDIDEYWDNEGLSGNQTFNMTMEIWDREHTSATNISTNIEFTVSDEFCYVGELSEGEEPNQMPEFLTNPTPHKPSPYCAEYGTSVYGTTVFYTCERDVCFTDAEDDDIFFSIDCDGDGTFEKSTEPNFEYWSCYYNDTDITNTKVRVFDHDHRDVSDIVIINFEVSNDTLVCGANPSAPELFFGLDQGLESSISTPFCPNQNITFTCNEGECYFNPEDGNTLLYIDCDNDDIFEQSKISSENFTFICEQDNASATGMTVQIYVKNLYAQSSVGSYYYPVSNSSLCTSQADYDEAEDESRNAIEGVFHDYGESLNMSTTLTAMFFLTILAGIVYFGALKKGADAKHGFYAACGSYVIGTILLTVCGVINYIPLIIIILLISAAIAFKLTSGNGGA